MTEQRLRAERSTERHIQYSKDRIEEECLSLEAPAMRDCVREQIQSSQDHYRAEQDLNAQQAMALYTMIMGWTAAIGLVVGIGSVFLIFWTLRVTQIMAVDQRRIGQSQVRAYLGTTDTTIINLAAGYKPAITINIRNSGQSPARITKQAMSLRSFSGEDEAKFFNMNPKTAHINVSAGSLMPQTLSFGEIDQELIDALVREDQFIFVAGYLVYLDVFGKTQRLVFKFMLDPESVRRGDPIMGLTEANNRAS